MDPSKINYITIHCTATPEGRDNKADEIRKWDIARFGQPSYHYVIELDGEIVQHLQHNQLGAHVGGHNTGNIGISYVGGTTTLNAGAKPKDTRTRLQKESLEHLLRRLLILFPNAKIRGHRDWPNVQKACPSFDVQLWLSMVGLGKHFG